MKLTDIQIGWLAGIWDGEGSVGARRLSKTNIGTNVQLSMTCKETVERILDMLRELGVTGLGYTFVENSRTKAKGKMAFKDSHLIRINRATDAILLAQSIGTISVTKAKQWKLVLELALLKTSRRRVMPDGKLARGGIPNKPTSEREYAIYSELRALNHRNRAYATAKTGRKSSRSGK